MCSSDLDPLPGFDWPSLYRRYDSHPSCKRFAPASDHLSRFGSSRPASDRQLYYRLVGLYAPDARSADSDTVGLYESLLYWKLYSQPAARSQIGVWLAPSGKGRAWAAVQLPRLLRELPPTIGRDVDAVVDLVEGLGRFELPGAASCGAIPVRSTLLHFLYPSVVPIFDKMVLQAVGVDEPNANHKISVFRKYVLHVWGLADRHAAAMAGCSETALRLTDMSLWIIREVLSGR